jgi:hypothetical protein
VRPGKRPLHRALEPLVGERERELISPRTTGQRRTPTRRGRRPQARSREPPGAARYSRARPYRPDGSPMASISDSMGANIGAGRRAVCDRRHTSFPSSPRGAPRDARVAGTPLRGPMITGRCSWVPALATLGRDDPLIGWFEVSTCGCRKRRPGKVLCIGPVLYREPCNCVRPQMQMAPSMRVRRRRGKQDRYCLGMPARSITAAHLPISPVSRALSSSGVLALASIPNSA